MGSQACPAPHLETLRRRCLVGLARRAVGVVLQRETAERGRQLLRAAAARHPERLVEAQRVAGRATRRAAAGPAAARPRAPLPLLLPLLPLPLLLPAVGVAPRVGALLLPLLLLRALGARLLAPHLGLKPPQRVPYELLEIKAAGAEAALRARARARAAAAGAAKACLLLALRRLLAVVAVHKVGRPGWEVGGGVAGGGEGSTPRA
jgi:hypothetical protein